MASLLSKSPVWPDSTKRINTLTIAIRYQTNHALKQHIASHSTLYLELIDYPGEWLIDLPMLEQDFKSWSEHMLCLLEKPEYQIYATEFLSELVSFNTEDDVNEAQLKQLAVSYTDTIKRLKKHTQLAYLQPGRQLIPGDLEDAPILLFFPCRQSTQKENSQYQHLVKRFEAYKKQVIMPFYKQYFCEFDRQLVLVDVMSALNDGPQSLYEQKQTLQAILQSFSYGRSNLIKRLFAPKIDKVLFAANKCDHVNCTQQVAIAQLLHDLVGEQANEMRFNGVTIETMAMSSIQSTMAKSVKEGNKSLSCIFGKPLNEDNWLTYLPPEPPNHFISQSQWPDHGFDFLSFSPLPSVKGEFSHVRLDHALQFLIGDKLQ
jgi:predicted YcjX-like family ATPase